MRTLIKYLILAILIALLFSCGNPFYKGHRYREVNGTLIKADPKHRYSLFK